MDFVSFITNYRKILHDRISDVGDSIASGGCKDFEEYRARVSEIQGLRYALNELQVLLKRGNMSDDEPDST